MLEEYKNKIVNFYERERRMPSYAEIMKFLGLKSKNSVYKIINKLVESGVLEKDHNGRLMPLNIDRGIKLLGLVEAGIPTTASEEDLDTLNLDDFLIKNKSNTFLLEVKGDSMIEEGICEGDLVVAERRNDAKDGEIVIAEVDGGWTMKYLRKKGNKVYLEPANKNYKPIYPEYDLKISAVVKGVIRKY